MSRNGLSNAAIAELLAREAEKAEGQISMAFKRAARMAFLWPEEARDVVSAGRSLTELPAIGPFLEKRVRAWIDKPPPVPESPEERRDFITLTEARRTLARNPRWRDGYRGDLQMHSEWSDGSSSIAQLAERAQGLGYEYIAITDHSKGLKIAGGIDERELAKQEVEIEAINNRLLSQRQKFRVLRSIEMNLNPRGEGDMDRAVLAQLDLVVGSFHSSLRGIHDQTERYLSALRNPDVHILGHPRGRIYNYRLGLRADWRRVFAAAAELDKAVEIDSYPDRQDLNVELLKIARAEGVRVAIDTDAHAPEQLGFAELGLAAALAARIPAERIINFLSADRLLAWAAEGRVKSLAVLA
jgi:histidinol phosphatase-like PHP family hydrolase